MVFANLRKDNKEIEKRTAELKAKIKDLKPAALEEAAVKELLLKVKQTKE
jgi:cell division protein FtsB